MKFQFMPFQLATDKQVSMIKMFTIGVLVLTSYGFIGTYLVSRDQLSGQITMLTMVISTALCVIVLFLLSKKYLQAAVFVLGVGGIFMDTLMLFPYGVIGTRVTYMFYAFPLVILGQFWGRLGVVIACSLTACSLLFVLWLETQGLAGFAAPPEGELVTVVSISAILLLVGLIVSRSQSEITSLVQQLRQSNAQERQTRELIRAVQHELKDQTGALAGLVDLLKETDDRIGNSQAHRAITTQVLDGSVRELHDLAHTLLVLGASDEQIPLHRQHIDLPEFLQALADTLQVQSRATATIIIDAPKHLGSRIDPTYFSLAIRTVLRNALQAIGQTSLTHPALIYVRVTQQGSHIHITVEDTGPGFSDAVLSRLHASRDVNDLLQPGVSSRAGGYGLGLSLADRIAALHGGGVIFGNRPEHSGAWVRIEIAST